MKPFSRPAILGILISACVYCPGAFGQGITGGATPAPSTTSAPETKDQELPPVLLTIKGVSPKNSSSNANTTTPASDVAESPADRAKLLAAANASNADNAEQASKYSISQYTVSLAREWSFLPYLETMEEAFNRSKATHRAEDNMDLLLAKQRATEAITALGFDVRRCTNAIDREIARNQERSASLTELRDKAIRFNTYANFIAGGLTGIISGALEIADLSRFSYNSIDIVEGAGQSGLSLWAFKAEHEGDRRQTPLPNVLSGLIPGSNAKSDVYPPSVRVFLESTAPDNPTGMNRGATIVERWHKLDFCLTHQGHKKSKSERIAHLTGNNKQDVTVTIDLIEDRIAMLHDMRAEVTEMDEYLAELLNVIRKY